LPIFEDKGRWISLGAFLAAAACASGEHAGHASHALDVVQQRRLLEEAEAVISKQSLSRELAINRIRDALLKSGVQPR